MVTINTIEVMDKLVEGSATVSDLEKALRHIGITDAHAFSTSFFSLAGEMTEEELLSSTSLVNHNVTQTFSVNDAIDTDRDWKFAIKVDYKAGVTDNAARVLKTDLGLKGLGRLDVYTSMVHYIDGDFNEELREQLERLSSNPQIHDITILTNEDYDAQGGFENNIHPVELGSRPNYFNVNLADMDHEELLRTGKLGTLNLDLVKPEMTQRKIDELRGGTLALAEDYMQAILSYTLSEKNTNFGHKKGELTDTELEVLAQMWSEHCRHSLYNARIPESEEGIFDEYIRKPTLEVLKDKPHLGISVYKDNAGVFEFIKGVWNLAVKNETHNSPTALDPFGGAITGIVGVNRDPAGTGKGAEVILNFLAYFFGHIDDLRKFYKGKTEDGTLVDLLLNPGQIYVGAARGVEQGGNQKGISINLGMLAQNDRYNGKPIVGVGCVGRMPPEINGEPTHEKHIDAGDRLYVIGGRAGRDGIHGATFSSEGLTQNSPATAVQIGDPYTQRKALEALLELRDKGYIKFVTDLGAGGISCAAFEMAEETNGLEMDLDKLLVKYEGMTATELLLNESQERMAIAVDSRYSSEIEEILKKHEVEFSDIGVFTDSGRAIVKSKNEEVVNLDMEFVNKGYPQRSLKPSNYKLSPEEIKTLKLKLEDSIFLSWKGVNSTREFIRKDFYDMLRRPNLSSIAPFMDKMDSTVKGLQVQHCIQGKGRISTKTACTLVDENYSAGLIQSYGHTERQSYIDSEKMGKNSFIRSIGRTISMGGRLDHMVATDQALWQSSDKPEYQQMLIEANRGMSKVINDLKIPVISGKDSMYNQVKKYDENGNLIETGVYPTLFMLTFAKIDNVDDIVTIDAKQEGDLVYVVGSTTKADMGGSEYLHMHSERQGTEFNIGDVSDEDLDDVYDTFEKMNKANQNHLLQSSNYVAEGGLVTAVKETAMAGELGIKFDIANVHQSPELDIEDIMYGETEGRFLVTIKQENKAEFEALFNGKYSQIGTVQRDKLTMQNNSLTLLSESLDDVMPIYHAEDLEVAA